MRELKEIKADKKLLTAKIRELKKTLAENQHTYNSMLGKYAKVVDDMFMYSQGTTGDRYIYEQAAEVVERVEREAYYKKHVAPLKVKIEEFQEVLDHVENERCLVVHGMTSAQYRHKLYIEQEEKELASLLEKVEKKKAHIESLKKELV